MSKIEYLQCDLCKKTQDVKKHKMQVIFETDQTEGRSCPAYLSLENVDLCKECIQHITKSGRYLRAYGAQGFNNFCLPKED